MKLNKYQELARATDQLRNRGQDPTVVALLGLAGEVGSVHTLYKKKRRDGESFTGFKDRVKEELGDILWYLTAIANIEDIALEEVAEHNIEKVTSRFLPAGEDDGVSFDEDFPVEEQLPRQFTAEFRRVGDGRGIQVFLDGKKFGSDLTDNAYSDDGYRFHDIFHMTCAAVLGWSPVFRALLNRKRKSIGKTDEVEDGGRAIVVDEAVAAVAFAYAVQHSYLEGISSLDWRLLEQIHELTRLFEVGKRSAGEWEGCILKAFAAWRQVKNHGEGMVRFNADEQTVIYSSNRVCSRD